MFTALRASNLVIYNTHFYFQYEAVSYILPVSEVNPANGWICGQDDDTGLLMVMYWMHNIVSQVPMAVFMDSTVF
jgi:hypothetical protein